MKKMRIGIIGFGTVGSGVVRILREKRALLAAKIGTEITISRICDKDITSKRNVAVDKSLLSHNPADILNDPQVDVVVELMGGIHPAKEYIIEALHKGKNVVTANKALLAEEGKELFSLAADRGKSINFEASVAAGIPIIKSIREGLVANQFSRVFGIINGTSNFVLSQMTREGCTFNEALDQARRRGYAERNPTLDIEGIDSAHKLLLLTYLCFGKMVSLPDIFVEGIQQISSADINYARELGFAIKLLAIAKKQARELDVRVHPTLIPAGHLLASVSGIFNAIYVESDLAGELLFYGPGAGQLSAASAVVSDLVDLAQDLKAGMFRPVLQAISDASVATLRKIDDIDSRYYIRFTTVDTPGVLAKISGVLAKYGISIASVTQKERIKNAREVPIVMITYEAKERALRSALAGIDRMDIVRRKSVAIRMEAL